MIYQGLIQQGRLILENGVSLPEGAQVKVEVISPKMENLSELEKSSLYERYKDFIGVLDDLPADFAANHDHYIHGTPKK